MAAFPDTGHALKQDSDKCGQIGEGDHHGQAPVCWGCIEDGWQRLSPDGLHL